MPPPRGSRNAAAYHKARVDEAKENISAKLRVVARSRVVFQNLSALSDYLAPQVGRSANRLRRNPTYRAMLSDHLSRQRGAASLICERDRDINTLNAKLRAAQLEITNVTRDRDRQKALIDRHLLGMKGLIDSAQHAGAAPSSVAKAAAEYRIAFETTAQVLAILLERTGELGYVVDIERGTILDKSARPGQEQVAGPNQARWFIEWLQSKS